MDCYKLHNYWHNTYPKKSIQITYNSWLSDFDNLSFDKVKNQIEIASKLGVEYFVIDAGWFGNKGNWYESRGDWQENSQGVFFGRMNKIADEIRNHNMKFGLWFEIESANINSEIIKKHKDYFIIQNELCFLDFSNKDACEYIIDVLNKNIEKYNIEYIKFDYNQDMLYDNSGKEFIDYFKGYDDTIKSIKKKHPKLYFENCASGGQRMNLKNCIDFDGFWPSDNESPYEQLRIFKDTVLRIPPQYFDRWITITSMQDFEPVYGKQEGEKIISCGDATWDNVVGVHQDFLNAFLTGGSIGLSCDLTKLSDLTVKNLQEYIAEIKQNRVFWNNAVCRIIASTEEVLVLQYSDIDLSKIKIVIYTYKIRQNMILVYPVLDDSFEYIANGKLIKSNDGIEVSLDGNYRAAIIEINKK